MSRADLLHKWKPILSKCLEVPTSKYDLMAVLLDAAESYSQKGILDTAEITSEVIPALRRAFAADCYGDADNLSASMEEFVDSPCGSQNFPEMIRCTLLQNVLSSVQRPSNPKQLISDQARLADKLHDREPGLIIAEVESRCPKFFDELPRRDISQPPDFDQKRQFLCNFIRHFFHQGQRKYAKPNLRGKKKEVQTVS